jgi:hypothetical protein
MNVLAEILEPAPGCEVIDAKRGHTKVSRGAVLKDNVKMTPTTILLRWVSVEPLHPMIGSLLHVGAISAGTTSILDFAV